MKSKDTYSCDMCGKKHSKRKVDRQKLGNTYMMDGKIKGKDVLFCFTHSCVQLYKVASQHDP